MRSGVLLMTTDAKLASTVTQALAANGHVLSPNSPRDSRELQLQLNAEPTPVALIDLDPQPREILADLERIIERYPSTRFVALSDTIESSILMEAMQAGVRRVMPKETLRAELAGVLNRLAPHDAVARGPVGQIVTVLSAGGGCGATTVCANLAAELVATGSHATSSVLLMDLDSIYGALATYFGLAPQYAIDHVLKYEGPRDVELVRSTTTVHSPQIHVLASPASTRPARAQQLDYTALPQVVNLAAQAYPFVLIDAPRLDPEVMAKLVSISSRVLLVFQLNVKDLRTARSMIDALVERGVARQHIVGIANRFAKRPAISVEDAARVLEGAEVKTVRNDYASALEGLNFGKTLSHVAPRSPLRRDLQDLATALVTASVPQ